jgi:hypothetical protein
MNAFVIIFSAIGLAGAYALGLYMYGHQVRQKQLEELARLYAQNPDKFGAWIYQISLKVIRKEIEKKEAALQNEY